MEPLSIGVGIYCLNNGNGLDMSCYQQLEEMVRLGHDVHVYHGGTNMPEIEGATYHYISEYKRVHKISGLAAAENLNRHDFFVSWSAPFYLLAPRLDNHVMVEFGVPFPLLGADWREALVNFYVRKATLWSAMHSRAILAGSEYLYNKIVPYAQYKDNVFVIHSGINFDNVGMACPETPPYMLYVGRHVPYKNVHTLLRLFREVRKVVPSARIYLVGYNTINPYKKLWHEMKLTMGATANGYVEDLWSVYRGASCYVTCSLWEGEDRPALEAQSMGLPVVSYNNCSHPEVVHHGRRVCNDHDFIKAVSGYMTDPGAGINPFVGAFIRSEYSVEAVVSKWIEKVRRVLV